MGVMRDITSEEIAAAQGQPARTSTRGSGPLCDAAKRLNEAAAAAWKVGLRVDVDVTSLATSSSQSGPLPRVDVRVSRAL